MGAQDETVPRLLRRVRGDYRKASECISHRPGEEPKVFIPKPPGERKLAETGPRLRPRSRYRLPRDIMRKD